MTYFTKRYHPPGTSPGTLSEPDEPARRPLKITLVDYTGSDYQEHELVNAEECRPFLERETITWIHVQGTAAADTMRHLGDLFGLHHLALEDVINTGQRPKLEEYAGQLFVVMSHPVIDWATKDIWTEQLSLFVGRDFVISFYPGEDDPFAPVRQRLRNHAGRLRNRGPDYLCYALIDTVIDQGFPVLEWFGDEIEDLENELLQAPTRSSLHRLHQLKRTLTILRRMLWPQREMLSGLVRDENALIAAENQLYFRDCYDHTIQVLDLIETYRETLTGLLDIYMSSVSYRMNETMRVLTIIATIFIPLSFVVGVYGMNFAHATSPWSMPELRWYYGYPLVWLVMAMIAGGMLVYFRRRKWL